MIVRVVIFHWHFHPNLYYHRLQDCNNYFLHLPLQSAHQHYLTLHLVHPTLNLKKNLLFQYRVPIFVYYKYLHRQDR